MRLKAPNQVLQQVPLKESIVHTATIRKEGK